MLNKKGRYDYYCKTHDLRNICKIAFYKMAPNARGFGRQKLGFILSIG